MSWDSEARRYVDARCGFSVAVPGFPELLPADPAARPVRHAVLRARAAPIEVGFRLDRIPGGGEPARLVPVLVAAYAHNEAARGVRVAVADTQTAARWGVNAAASAIYALARGPDVGEVTMLARREMNEGTPGVAVMVISKRFDRRKVDPFVWASFNSAMMGSLSWRPEGAEAAAEVPVLWPPSDWFQPGIALEPVSGRGKVIYLLQALFEGIDLSVLAAIASWLPLMAMPNVAPGELLDDEVREVVLRRFRGLLRSEAMRQVFVQTIERLRYVHDLRGVGLALRQGLGG